MQLQGFWLMMLTLVTAQPAAEQPVATDEGEGRKRPILILSSPSILPKGAFCQIILAPEQANQTQVETRYTGTIVKADDNGISLAVTSEERIHTPTSPATRIPFVNRLFKSTGTGRILPDKDKEVWIPIGKIQAVDLMRARPTPDRNQPAPIRRFGSLQERQTDVPRAK